MQVVTLLPVQVVYIAVILDSAAERDAEELMPMLNSNHSKQDDGQASTATATRSRSRSCVAQVPVSAAPVRLTPPVVCSSARSVLDVTAVSDSLTAELGERHKARRDSRRPSNVGELSSLSSSYMD